MSSIDNVNYVYCPECGDNVEADEEGNRLCEHGEQDVGGEFTYSDGTLRELNFNE
jgi:hypothetical protein